MKKWLAVLIGCIVLLCGCEQSLPNEQKTQETQPTRDLMDYDAMRSTRLEMPDRIEYPNGLIVVPFDEFSMVYHYQGKTEIVEFTWTQVKELNKLYNSITEFKNVSEVDDADVRWVEDGKTTVFSGIGLTDPKLEEYLDKVAAYYYDGAIYPEREQTETPQ